MNLARPVLSATDGRSAGQKWRLNLISPLSAVLVWRGHLAAELDVVAPEMMAFAVRCQRRCWQSRHQQMRAENWLTREPVTHCRPQRQHAGSISLADRCSRFRDE